MQQLLHEKDELILQLKSENFDLRNIINHLPSNVYWKDQNGVYLGGNLNSAKLAGLTHPDEFTGKRLSELMDSDYAKEIEKQDREILLLGQEHYMEEICFDPTVIHLPDQKGPLT